MNLLFPLLLTRQVLPRLRAAALHGPAEVHFIGSLASGMTFPRIATYASSKAFLLALTRCLDVDERIWDTTGVRLTYSIVGSVTSNSLRAPPSLVTPSSETFARSAVAHLGCGRTVYAPYVWHAVASWVVALLGPSVQEGIGARAMKGVLDEAEKTK